MALTKVSTDGVKDDAITKTKIPANQIEASELADNAVDTNAIADQAVALSKLPHGTSSNDGKFLRANNGADPTFETVTGTTINNNADNRLITGSGTANTLEGEANLTFDGGHLELSNGRGIRTNFIRPTQSGNTNTGGASQQYWKIGDINLNGSEGAVITLFGANGYSSGGSNFASETTIVLRGGNANTLLGFWYSDSGTGIATYSDVRWKYSSGTTYELWVSAGSFNNIAPIVKTTGTFDQTNAAGTGSNNVPSGSTALPSGYCKQVGTIQTIEYQSTGTIFKKDISIASGEGIYMDGGSTSANYFDDYEQGTYNPTLTGQGGGSISIYSNEDTLSYTKVGNIVHVHGRIRLHIVNNSMSGQARLSLPFTSAAGTDTSNQGQSAVATHGVTLSSSSDIGMFLETVGSSSNGYLNITRYSQSWTAVTANQFGGTGATSNHYLAFNHTYQAA